ncbi:hypothetical protein HK096_007531 [Nowakowskiella sp. JEL0078]|nr:hypothetical protein HK096_007531 [Nowakowskiella sp. JEL0078]
MSSQQLQNSIISNQPSKKPKKKAYRFNIAADIALLKEIANIQPFFAAHGQTLKAWTSVAVNLCSSLNLEAETITTVNARARFESIYTTFKKDEMESLRASGTEEEFNEREQLMTDIHSLIEESEFIRLNVKEKKRSDEDKREVNGEILRNAALQRLSSKKKEIEVGETENGSESEDISDKSFSKKIRTRTSSSVLEENSHYLTSDSAMESKLIEIREAELQQQAEKLHLEREKWEMEKQERELHLKQGQQQLELLAKIIDKLK